MIIDRTLSHLIQPSQPHPPSPPRSQPANLDGRIENPSNITKPVRRRFFTFRRCWLCSREPLRSPSVPQIHCDGRSPLFPSGRVRITNTIRRANNAHNAPAAAALEQPSGRHPTEYARVVTIRCDRSETTSLPIPRTSNARSQRCDCGRRCSTSTQRWHSRRKLGLHGCR
jgi:hypothetical protein